MRTIKTVIERRVRGRPPRKRIAPVIPDTIKVRYIAGSSTNLKIKDAISGQRLLIAKNGACFNISKTDLENMTKAGYVFEKF